MHSEISSIIAPAATPTAETQKLSNKHARAGHASNPEGSDSGLPFEAELRNLTEKHSAGEALPEEPTEKGGTAEAIPDEAIAIVLAEGGQSSEANLEISLTVMEGGDSNDASGTGEAENEAFTGVETAILELDEEISENSGQPIQGLQATEGLQANGSTPTTVAEINLGAVHGGGPVLQADQATMPQSRSADGLVTQAGNPTDSLREGLQSGKEAAVSATQNQNEVPLVTEEAVAKASDNMPAESVSPQAADAVPLARASEGAITGSAQTALSPENERTPPQKAVIETPKNEQATTRNPGATEVQAAQSQVKGENTAAAVSDLVRRDIPDAKRTRQSSESQDTHLQAAAHKLSAAAEMVIEKHTDGAKPLSNAGPELQLKIGGDHTPSMSHSPGGQTEIPVVPVSDTGGTSVSQTTIDLKAGTNLSGSATFKADVSSAAFEQIVEKAVLHHEQGQTQMKIDLKPDYLGHVKMEIVTENQQVMVRVMAEHPMVKEMIETNLSQLKADLNQHGLQIERLDVEVADHSAFQKQAQEQSGRRQRGTGRSSGSQKIDADVSPLAGQAQNNSMIGASGRISLFA